jgi:hypothetical protein
VSFLKTGFTEEIFRKSEASGVTNGTVKGAAV